VEEQFRMFASYLALALELVVALTVAIGAVEAVWMIVRSFGGRGSRALREPWRRFAGWILISLEFALGADIIRTAIAPTWDDIGMLGAIAAIRTALGYFLGRDLAEAREMGEIEPAKR